MREAKVRIGDKVKVSGIELEVINIEVTAYSDMGCGPVFDITKIKCENQSGTKLEITVEDGI